MCHYYYFFLERRPRQQADGINFGLWDPPIDANKLQMADQSRDKHPIYLYLVARITRKEFLMEKEVNKDKSRDEI